MVSILSLWLPILLSAVFVFVISFVIHMVLPYHRTDFRSVPSEAQVAAALRPFAIPPGDYMLPRPANPKEMGAPEFQEKLRQGPVLMATVYPNGPFTMGSSLVQWFVYALAVSVFAAYVTSRAVVAGAEYLEVFRFAGTTAFLGYAGALAQASIWMKKSWSATLKSMFDGLIYGLFTAGAFGWLWPA